MRSFVWFAIAFMVFATFSVGCSGDVGSTGPQVMQTGKNAKKPMPAPPGG